MWGHLSFLPFRGDLQQYEASILEGDIPCLPASELSSAQYRVASDMFFMLTISFFIKLRESLACEGVLGSSMGWKKTWFQQLSLAFARGLVGTISRRVLGWCLARSVWLRGFGRVIRDLNPARGEEGTQWVEGQRLALIDRACEDAIEGMDSVTRSDQGSASVASQAVSCQHLSVDAILMGTDEFLLEISVAHKSGNVIGAGFWRCWRALIAQNVIGAATHGHGKMGEGTKE
ncbi:hypothetical protein CYMTET_12995 [Cymbomonas tetramitiformis]|uniref:Uncharacterized protein n=1 Tax=Cymbomonas tetramitiformis TaxID=36881 RepID=A0AAE0GIZ4_9CHLO|nr:hypothetical protein CYMTET_12995 [Cymbomonas tetramitiformis]